MGKYSIGAKKLRIGDVGAAGIMGTGLTAYKPYKGTVNLTEEDPTNTPHHAENARYPDVVVTENGATNFNFEIHDMSAANLAKFVGGEASTDTWTSGTDHFQIEQSVEIDTIFEETWQIPRMMLTGTITWNANRTDIARIKVSGMVLQPEDDSTLPLKKIPTPTTP